MPSPLFPNFNRLIRQQLEALKKKSQLDAAAKQASGYRAGQPMRYGDLGGNLWKSIVGKMGPWGALVDSLFRGQGKRVEQEIAKELEQALKSAQDLLESHGFEVARRSEPTKPITRELIEEAPQTAPAEAPPSKPPRERPAQSAPGEQPRRNEQPVSPSNAPTGQIEQTESGQLVEWVMVTRSSNVHSFAYEWNPESRQPGNLLVRFLGGDSKHRAGPGALYRYHDVPRSVFVAMKMASSKGGFVWDELRIRGTVAGHQYAYDLAGTGPGGYIPRQAVVGFRGRASRGGFAKRKLNGRESALPQREFQGGRALTQDFRGKAAAIRLRAGRK